MEELSLQERKSGSNVARGRNPSLLREHDVVQLMGRIKGGFPQVNFVHETFTLMHTRTHTTYCILVYVLCSLDRFT